MDGSEDSSSPPVIPVDLDEDPKHEADSLQEREHTQENTITMPYMKVAHREAHKEDSGKYVKSMIYGGLDGIVSVFVSVAAVAGGSSPSSIVLILGLAKLLAGAISMGVGDWMATAADVDHAKVERKREIWECDNYMEGEIEEMVELYVDKGMNEASARRLFEIISPHRKLFVDMMMVNELGILPEDEDDIPWKHGAVNFGSFIAFGVVPLIGYVIFIFSAPDKPSLDAFGVSIASTGLTLFLMGMFKGKMTGTNLYRSGLVSIAFGSIGAIIGWLTSFILNIATGVSSS